LRSAYHQLRIILEGIPKIALRTRFGHYEFTMMPFGLIDAPMAFMDFTNIVFRPYLDKFVAVFKDDILTYSNVHDEHTIHLRTVLQTLRERQLLRKYKKCEFCLEQVLFFGHVISKKGIKVDLHKMKATTECQRPTNVTATRNFLGLVR